MNVSPLLDLQQKIFAAIADDSAKAWEQSEDLVAQPANSSLTPNLRLSIYSNAYVSRLTECLGKDFSTLKKILNSDNFQDLVVDFMARNPSTDPNINEFGRALPFFIAEHPLNLEVPFLRETAELEWVVHATHYAPLAAPFDFSKLATLTENDWMKAKFELTPSLQILRGQWPVIDLWLKREAEDFSDSLSKFRAEETLTVVYRSPAGVFLERLSPMQALTLELMKERKTLAEISQALAAKDVAESEIMTWFSNWAASKIICNVYVS